jgi:hypothetical protein
MPTLLSDHMLLALPVLGIRDIFVRIRLLSSVTLRMQKNYFFPSYFFLITYPQPHYLQSYNFQQLNLLIYLPISTVIGAE